MNLPRAATWAWVAGILLAAGLLLLACECTPPREVVLIGGADSEGVGSHDYPQGDIPPKVVLAMRSGPRIVDALGHGAMRLQAQGLSKEHIDAMARYL